MVLRASAKRAVCTELLRGNAAMRGGVLRQEIVGHCGNRSGVLREEIVGHCGNRSVPAADVQGHPLQLACLHGALA
eukprot:1891836-Rhodomonas_salina.2